MSAPSVGAAASSASASAAPNLHGPTRKGDRVFVILRETLDALGVPGEEVSVAPGYARNFLIPKRMAVYATPVNRAKFKVAMTAEQAAASAEARQARLVQARVADIILVFKRASMDGNKLFGGVSAADVAAALMSTPLNNLGVTDSRVRLTPGGGGQAGAEMLMSLGEHTVEIEPKANPGLWCTLTVKISAT